MTLSTGAAPKRIAFLNTHPIQYFAPLYAYLNAAEDLEVAAIYLSDFSLRGGEDRAFGQKVAWDVDLLSGYEPIFAPGADRRPEPTRFLSMVAPQLWSLIGRERLDALIVHGHAPAALLVGVAAAKAHGVPVFMRGETHLGLARSGLKAALRTPLMRAFYARFDGLLAIGSANRDFYRAMGVSDARIFQVPYTVDNARFSAGAALTAAERAARRAGLGVEDDRPILLYAAKFQRRKRPDDLLRAAAALQRSGVRFHLAMVGSGEMDGDLRQLARDLAISDVSFPGFVNQSGLPGLYAACDVFVLPSENEPWGLAINEAMCAGLPIVASAEIGCVRDLVRPGENGALFTAGEVVALAAALEPVLKDAALRARMADASRRIISGWSYAECLDGVRQALASLPRRSAAPARSRRAEAAGA